MIKVIFIETNLRKVEFWFWEVTVSKNYKADILRFIYIYIYIYIYMRRKGQTEERYIFDGLFVYQHISTLIICLNIYTNIPAKLYIRIHFNGYVYK